MVTIESGLNDISPGEECVPFMGFGRINLLGNGWWALHYGHTLTLNKTKRYSFMINTKNILSAKTK